MSFLKHSARFKLVIILVLSSILFFSALVFVTRDNLFNFFRETQQETLTNMSVHVTDLLKVNLDQAILLLLDLEQRVKQEQNPDNIAAIINSFSENRGEYIRGIVYIRNSGEIIGYPQLFWDFFSDKEKQMIAEASKEDMISWSPGFFMNFGSIATSNPVSMATKNILGDDGEKIGTITVVIDLSVLLKNITVFAGNYEINTLLYDQKDTYTCLVGNNTYANQALKIYPHEFGNLKSTMEFLSKNKFYYSISELNYNPRWKVVVIGDFHKMASGFKPLNNIMLLVFVFGIIGLISIYIFISWWFTRPLMQIIKGMRQVGKGDFDYKIELLRHDEFAQVAQEFNRMTSMTKQLIVELQEANEKKRQSDFKVLLSQINPHFLYNTLNSIDLMVDFSPKAELHQMLAVLVGLLKYGLDRTTERRTLTDEFDYLRKYLYIQSVRYQGRFDFYIEDPGKLGEIGILKLILQPLVENAIFHGLHPLKGRRGCLKVWAERKNDVLIITVEDNGVGIPEHVLKTLFKENLESEQVRNTGIGIANVHERLQLYYGKQYGLEICGVEGCGTTIRVKVPIGEPEALPSVKGDMAGKS